MLQSTFFWINFSFRQAKSQVAASLIYSNVFSKLHQRDAYHTITWDSSSKKSCGVISMEIQSVLAISEGPESDCDGRSRGVQYLVTEDTEFKWWLLQLSLLTGIEGKFWKIWDTYPDRLYISDPGSRRLILNCVMMHVKKRERDRLTIL